MKQASPKNRVLTGAEVKVSAPAKAVQPKKAPPKPMRKVKK